VSERVTVTWNETQGPLGLVAMLVGSILLGVATQQEARSFGLGFLLGLALINFVIGGLHVARWTRRLS
jgi:hypothetical protein